MDQILGYRCTRCGTTDTINLFPRIEGKDEKGKRQIEVYCPNAECQAKNDDILEILESSVNQKGVFRGFTADWIRAQKPIPTLNEDLQMVYEKIQAASDQFRKYVHIKPHAHNRLQVIAHLKKNGFAADGRQNGKTYRISWIPKPF